jgi:hypothetical protein
VKLRLVAAFLLRTPRFLTQEPAHRDFWCANLPAPETDLSVFIVPGLRSFAAADASLLISGLSLLSRSQNLDFWPCVCTSDLPMCAGVQITFRRASSILSRESQMTVPVLS